MAKVAGTLVSLAGVTTMTLFKGPVMKHPWHPLIHIQSNSIIHENWLKGSLLVVASCITWSLTYIMQVSLSQLINLTTNYLILNECKPPIFFLQTIGTYTEALSSTTVTDHMDVVYRGSTISRVHGYR